MEKEFIDELYHQLRLLSMQEDTPQKEALEGITSHLTSPGGNYVGLLRFLNYYGEKYILPKAIELLWPSTCFSTLKFNRVVDVGAGFGWLGLGISRHFNIPLVMVDKRQWPLIDVVADIETVNGAKRIQDELKPGDLIVMSELIHCLQDPASLNIFSHHQKLVVEYCPSNGDYMGSYNFQIARLGCSATPPIDDVFPNSRVLKKNADPYMIWHVLPPLIFPI